MNDINSPSVIDIVMPVEEGRHIPQLVLNGILMQGYPVRLWVSSKYSGSLYAEARNNIKQYGVSEKILMLDNDIVLPPRALHTMNSFLEQHPSFAAIAISKFRAPEGSKVFVEAHIDASCVLFRKAIFKGLNFRSSFQSENPECECINMCKDIRKSGYEIGYLTGMRVQHILDTAQPLEPKDIWQELENFKTG